MIRIVSILQIVTWQSKHSHFPRFQVLSCSPVGTVVYRLSADPGLIFLLRFPATAPATPATLERQSSPRSRWASEETYLPNVPSKDRLKSQNCFWIGLKQKQREAVVETGEPTTITSNFSWLFLVRPQITSTPLRTPLIAWGHVSYLQETCSQDGDCKKAARGTEFKDSARTDGASPQQEMSRMPAKGHHLRGHDNRWICLHPVQWLPVSSPCASLRLQTLLDIAHPCPTVVTFVYQTQYKFGVVLSNGLGRSHT